jgi:TPR repeat protein
MAPELLMALVRRGDAMLAVGDVSAARLLYERAASAGSGPAATAMGRTYDPTVLAALGVRGLRPDPATALTWYRRATALGDAEAEPLARRLGASRSR